MQGFLPNGLNEKKRKRLGLGSALDTGQILAGRHPQSGQALNSYQEIVALVPP